MPFFRKLHPWDLEWCNLYGRLGILDSFLNRTCWIKYFNTPLETNGWVYQKQSWLWPGAIESLTLGKWINIKVTGPLWRHLPISEMEPGFPGPPARPIRPVLQQLECKLECAVSSESYIKSVTMEGITLRAGVPSLWDLMSDDLRWSWCNNNNRNKVYNKCNVLESS